MTEILEIACDESGHTGPNLLQKDQRYFAYASVAIGDTDAFAIIQKARTAHPVQMPELKARALMGSAQGRRLIASLLRDIEGRYTERWPGKFEQGAKWIFCLSAARIAADQEQTCRSEHDGTTARLSRRR